MADPQVERVETPPTPPQVERVETPPTPPQVERVETPPTPPQVERVETPPTPPQVERVETPPTPPQVERVETPPTPPLVELVETLRGMAPDAPSGLLEAFADYELALGSDDLAAMDELFVDSPSTLRGDPGGLLVGHESIHDFRAVRRGAPPRTLAEVRVYPLAPDAAAVVAVTAPARGGRGLQTQVWQRGSDDAWRVLTAHVAPPPPTFDRAVWRVAGDPLAGALGCGPLDGETVAVKDLFAVAGYPIGAGVPAFLAEATPESADSAAVARLRMAGAAVAGIARTDQFAYSLAGDNPHYGTPVNPVVPGGLPGGSSSGSATAVSLGAASIGLATDTGGSVRVPASYQSLWGWRSTHGSVSSQGLLPLAPDFDTVGVLTRTPALLRRAASVLLADAAAGAVGGLAVASVLPALQTGVADAFEGWCVTRDADFGVVQLPDLSAAAEAFRVHQAFQAWQVHGAWVQAHPGALKGAAGQRFEAAAAITAADDAQARTTLLRLRAALDAALVDTVLVLPSAAGPAPKLWASPADVDAHRQATFRLTCIAGITGRPAVAVPALTLPDGPVGVCLVGPRGSDLALIELAALLAG
ncbi:AtzH-like domain-containing protein [Micropruina sp.]|uniref:AtzH-like domain-containing protein n=1 Tax=Micropruina sp. TaxID=2737536 RepID=UPI0039E669EF